MPIHTFPLDGPINLLVRVGHGSVTVETEDDLTEATVRLEALGKSEELDQITVVGLHGRTLTVAGPRQGGIFDLGLFGGRGNRRGVAVHVTVPSGTAVKISTVSAPIRILGRVSGADLAFGKGEAAVREVDGDLRLRFGQGTARAVHVGGSVQVRSGAGDVRLGEVGGDVHAGCGSGDLQVHVARGAVVARSGSGAARLGEVHGDVDLTSGSGRLEIGLPTGVSARLDLLTASGQVRSDLPIEDAPRSADGPITVRARTGNGDVHLFRAA